MPAKTNSSEMFRSGTYNTNAFNHVDPPVSLERLQREPNGQTVFERVGTPKCNCTSGQDCFWLQAIGTSCERLTALVGDDSEGLTLPVVPKGYRAEQS